MKKILLILSLTFLIGQAQAALLDPVYDQVRDQALAAFRDMFEGEVKIKSAGGRLVGRIVLNEVEIGADLKAQKVVLHYNVVKYLSGQMNMVPAINKIEIVNGRAVIRRDKNGDLNALHFLKPPQPGAPAAPPFKALLSIKNAQVDYVDEAGLPYKKKSLKHHLEKVSGQVNLSRYPQVTLSLKDGKGLVVKGSADLALGRYGLTLSAPKLSIRSWGNYVIPLFDFSSGTADLLLNISEKGLKVEAAGVADQINFKTETEVSFPQLKVSSFINVRSGVYLGQRFSGQFDLLFEKNRLYIQPSQILAYGGRVEASGEMDLNDNSFNVEGDFDGLDLARLNAPNVLGRAVGRVALAGTFDDFSGNFEAQLTQASAFGQPVEGALAEIKYQAGDLTLTNLNLFSRTAQFTGTGNMDREKQIKFKGTALGIKLAGSGVLGPMQALLNRFDGSLDFKIDEAFLKNPLKNIAAIGSFEVVEAQLGEQQLDEARGKIELSKGMIKIKEGYLRRNRSELNILGKMGLGQNDLRIYGFGLDLRDLKILNYVLPQDIYGLTGIADMDLVVTGELPEVRSIDSLLNLNARAVLKIRDGEISKVAIRQVSFEAVYQDRSLSLRDMTLKTRNSSLALTLAMNKDQTLEMRAKGLIDFSDFKPLLLGAAQVGGVGNIDLKLYGPRSRPQGSAELKIKNFYLNENRFDDISGKVEFEKQKLEFKSPLVFDSRQNRLKISGALTLKENLEAEKVKLLLEVERGSLKDVFKMLENLNQQIGRFLNPAVSQKIKIQVPVIDFIRPKTNQPYVLSGKETGILKTFQGIISQVEKYKLSQVPPTLQKMDGRLAGKILLLGQKGRFTASVEAVLAEGYYGKYDFDMLSLKAALSPELIKIESLGLRKREGWLALNGMIDLKEQELNLGMSAQDFPVDVLKLVADKPYTGGFDGRVRIYGKLQNPKFNADLKTRKVNLAGAEYDRIKCSLAWDGKTFDIQQFKMADSGGESSFSGYYSLSGQADISASLEGNSPGLINMLTDEIKWRGGKTKGQFHFTMQDNDPRVEGWLDIKEGDLYIKSLDSDLKKVEVNLISTRGRLYARRLMAYWLGNRTGNKINFLSLSGMVDFNQSLLSLSLNDAKLTVNFPNQYKGEVVLSNLHLSGTFNDMSLAGAVQLQEGILYLPDSTNGSAARSGEKSPLRFDLRLDLKQNLYLTAGNVMTLNLSNIMLNLEMTGENLKLSGDLNQPKLLGDVYFKRGTVNVFNREFVLQTTDAQKQFYPYEPDKVQDNYAHFSNDGLMPYLNLAAAVSVQTNKPSIDDPQKTIKKEVTIFSRIKGLLGAMDAERGINLAFDAFETDLTKSPPQYLKSAYSDQEIKILLLPDFIKAITGIEKGTPVENNAVLADYLSSRLQTVVFRGLERQVEKALGLQSLTLEYNFGADLKKAMGVSDVTVDRPTLGVGFVKGFFDRLYIDVRYSQWSGSATAGGMGRTALNYQITYKLSPVFSVAYYREPVSLEDLQSGPSKTTLSAALSF